MQNVVAKPAWNWKSRYKSKKDSIGSKAMKQNRKFKQPIYIGTGDLGGHSLLPDKEGWIISHMNPDGTINGPRLEASAAYKANVGANLTLDFSWAHTVGAWEVLSPFFYNRAGVALTWNQTFFDVQRETAITYGVYDITYAYYLFEHCHTKKVETARYSAWHEFEDFFYGNDAQGARNEYIGRFVGATLDTGMLYAACNEPEAGQFEMLADVIYELRENNVPWERIILPIDVYLKKSNPYQHDYARIRKILSLRLGISDEEMGTILKEQCISTIHRAHKNTMAFFGKNFRPGAKRPILLDFDGDVDDGERPTEDQAYEYAKWVIDVRDRAFEDGKIHFHTTRKKKTDPDSIKGIVRACLEAGYDPNPDHRGQYPEAKFPGPWGKKIDPPQPPPDNFQARLEHQIELVKDAKAMLDIAIKALEDVVNE